MVREGGVVKVEKGRTNVPLHYSTKLWPLCASWLENAPVAMTSRRLPAEQETRIFMPGQLAKYFGRAPHVSNPISQWALFAGRTVLAEADRVTMNVE